MKNLKKVLAMVLAFACTFSMFAGAKVFEDVPAGSDYSEAITMLSDLGVIQGKDDGKYHPEDTITRAEACAMIARLMTGDPNVSQYVGAQSFTDVAKGSWKDSAIGYCYINGIVIGVGNNKFEPDRAITDAEFITMVVRAMGYETADMKQNYPFSYMSNAQAIGLLDGTNMVASTDALRGEDAQVIYNALFADYARGAKLVNTTHGTSVETYPTLAESVWGLERAAVGTWKEKDDETATLEYCKAHTWVVLGADPTAEGHIIAYAIEDDSTDLYTDNKDKMVYSFKYAGDADAVAGYQVELWGEGSHGEPEWESKNDKYVWSDNWEIKAIKTVKGQKAYDYNASMADSKRDNGEIVIGEETLKLDSVADNANDAEKVQSVDQYLYEGYHGQTKLDDKKVEKALNIRDGAQYKLVDWDSDGDIDWAVVSTANYYKVDSVSSKRLTVSYMDTKGKDEEENTTSKTLTWKLDDLNDEKDYKVKVEAPEDLAEGDIIEVTYTTAYDKSEKAEVVTATVTKVEADTHELDKVSTKDNLVLTFDGETMELAQNKEVGDTIVPANPSKYIGFDEEELGTEFNIWTDRNGFIVYSDYATESTNYMMVLNTADGSDKTGDRKLAVVDFISADNKLHKDVELTSSARVLKDDGRTETGAYDDGDRTFNESLIVGNVYKYWTNEDGQITKMQEVVNDEKATDYDYVAKNDRLTLDDSESYALEDADVIFAVIGDYIKEEKINGNYAGLKVNDSDVLAVKQSDIPDIKAGGDTEPEVLDTVAGAQDDSWIANDANDYAEYTVALSADKNKDVSAAILGVDSFNKFNAGSTKVGLVTNVSYDKNDVVSIDVAYNGKVETISSAEKKDFDDIVSVMDYDGKNDTEEYSVGSRTETMNYTDYDGIMKGTNLKDYLNKSAAYAEITVDADGKLTDVMFMDQKGNDTNTVIGNYYQVSRKVITDVNEGKWISTYNGVATYASKDALYTIDGKPTRYNSYEDKALAILEGWDTSATFARTNFTENPDISVAEASDVEVSDIHNDADAANDTYYVADIASKIADDGKGDVVAVYMFEDDMDEVINYQGSAIVTASQVKVGEKTTVNVDIARVDSNIDTDKLYIDVVDKDGEKVLDEVEVSEGDNTVDTSKLAAGEYRVKLYGYNTANKEYQFLVDNRLVVSKLGVAGDVTGMAAEKLDNQTVKVTATGANGGVEDLKASDFTVKVDGAVMDASEYSIKEMGNGVYQVRALNGFTGKNVVVSVNGKDSAPVSFEAEDEKTELTVTVKDFGIGTNTDKVWVTLNSEKFFSNPEDWTVKFGDVEYTVKSVTKSSDGVSHVLTMGTDVETDKNQWVGVSGTVTVTLDANYDGALYTGSDSLTK
ncbi:MAG TPA: S-layer homology domain-containing protein [Butyricicoccus pullicaecorum]|nr:S-layer homology domain-containing protein [Butyricicoccus pullicaecorum]